MPIAIDPPQRIPRSRASALTTYFELDTSSLGDPNPNRWAFDGVNFVSVGCDFQVNPAALDPCDPVTVEDSTPPGMADSVTFPPFAFHVVVAWPANCLEYSEVEKHVMEAMQAELSKIFAEQVMWGYWNSAAESLVTAATEVTSTPIDSSIEAVAAVEEGLATYWHDAVGMIHVSPGVLFEISPHLEFADNRFYTPSGHIVVADAGYSGSAASGTTTSGISWVYGSSPVHYKYFTPNWSGEWWENFDFRRDEYRVRIDGVGIAIFEPCSVVAAQANLGAVSGEAGGFSLTGVGP